MPWFSIVFGGVFDCFLFLPFGGWDQLVGAITAASSFIYSFAPVAASHSERATLSGLVLTGARPAGHRASA